MMAEQSSPQNRIWELDFVRGVAIFAMCIIHVFALLPIAGGVEVQWNPFLLFVRRYGGVIFVMISGICVNFSKKPVKRGLIVFFCGMLLTGTTYFLYSFGFETGKILIWWGTLHFLGFAMIVSPLLKKIPSWLMPFLAAFIIVLGYVLRGSNVTGSPLLLPLGVRFEGFVTFDWWPILPNIGWFMLGMWLGRLLYPERKSRINIVSEKTPGINLFCFIGRNSLIIYMVHFPIIYFAIKLIC